MDALSSFQGFLVEWNGANVFLRGLHLLSVMVIEFKPLNEMYLEVTQMNECMLQKQDFLPCRAQLYRRHNEWYCAIVGGK